MLDLNLEPTAVERSGASGIVGQRQLICVQTFDIARLTSHPVVLIPGSFIAVGGQGPRGDSNESGKTSFLAATSLLLGDPEWRMSGGGPSATASLLFEPETAGVSAHTYAAARQGYVIGLFADPDDPQDSALTVWCRINATAEYFHVRYADGTHLVRGDSDYERHAAADAGWAAMPAASQLGARNYAERLYGDSPRCLAYVAERGKQKSAASLLQMNAGGFTPEQIGDDLIRLTGRAAAFENEAQHRQRLDAAQGVLLGKQRDHERISRDEEDQLEGVHARNRSRTQLSEAERIWKLHFARGLLDVLKREEQLHIERDQAEQDVRAHEAAVAQAAAEVEALAAPEELDRRMARAQAELARLTNQMDVAKERAMSARQAVEQARQRAHELDRVADGYVGPPSSDLRQRLDAAERARDEARESVGGARAHHDQAARWVDAAEAGAEGRAGELALRLAEHEVAAVPLIDVDLAEGARALWEPRLALFEHAVVVAPGQMKAALAAAADMPGAVLIAGEDETALPQGVLAAPAGAASFLKRLADQAAVADAPERAEHVLGVTVIGGFAEPQTGRIARLERARAVLRSAEAELERAIGRLDTAEIAVQSLGVELARAQAAEELVGAREALGAAERAAAASAHEVALLQAPLRSATEVRDDAAADRRHHQKAQDAARERLETRRGTHREAVRRASEVKRALENLQLGYWRGSWGGSAEAAQDALTDEPRSEKRLRNQAAELFQDALSALDIAPDGSGAPTPELDQVAKRRSQVFEDPEGRIPIMLADVARPLHDYLDTFHDQDLVVEERIRRGRQQREAELQLAEEECGRLERTLQTLQDAVEQRIGQALEAISAEYDRLNRESGWFGADLDIQPRRPEGAQERWRWLVTPRWRRSEGGRLLPYDNQANTAQRKLATVQLVLAALLAAPNPRGRVLILDELGDSLGVSHRREVLREIAETAQAKGVTVLGTCQDSVLGDASGFCGEILYFEYPSHAEALNRPTRTFGYDENRARVALSEHDLRDGRPWL